jgi:hypothetical protein
MTLGKKKGPKMKPIESQAQDPINMKMPYSNTGQRWSQAMDLDPDFPTHRRNSG